MIMFVFTSFIVGSVMPELDRKKRTRFFDASYGGEPGVQLDRHSLYEMLQILSLALLEQVPLHQLLTPLPSHLDVDFEAIPLVLH